MSLISCDLGIDTKKRGQNSIYVLEVFDYLTTNIMSKAHAVY